MTERKRLPAAFLVLVDAPDEATWCRHNYAGKLLAMVAAGELALWPGQVAHVDIFHDRDCPALSGGVCGCEPDVRLRGDPRDN